MPGGTCEASAYQALGYTATCLCLPLGNYHNMHPVEDTANPRKKGRAKIDSEVISIADYHGLIRLLVEVGRRLDKPASVPALKKRMDQLFARRKGLLR